MRIANDDIAWAIDGATVPLNFLATVARRPDQVALRWARDGVTTETTYREYADQATRVAAALAGANPHYALDVGDEDFAVTNFSSASGFDDGFDTAVYIVIFYYHFDFDFRQKVDHVLGPTVQLGMAFLATKTLDLCHSEASDAAVCQGFPYFFEFERFNDGGDLFHGVCPLFE